MTKAPHSSGNRLEVGQGTAATAIAFERFFTVKDVAALWKLSEDTVRRLFQHEPGVLAVSPRGRRGKRPYKTLRIPQSVFDRVHRKLSILVK